jgi:putative ABC transport system permease protein
MAIAPVSRHTLGALLIASQMALTLAILCNAVFIIHERVAITQRPSGMNEQNLFVMHNEWLRTTDDARARLETDLALVRKLPGVIDACASNTYPMNNSTSSSDVKLTSDQLHPAATAAVFEGDEHALTTLGLKLIAGRNFMSTELARQTATQDAVISAVIVSHALADKLFPRSPAVGRQIYIDGSGAVTIVGVVEALRVRWTNSTFNEDSMLWPVKLLTRNAEYMVRVQPGKLASVMAAAPAALYALDRARVLTSVRSMTDARREAYRDDRAYTGMLTTICVVMLAVTACGIVGLTSYWVNQRRRQIGIRRALGATRSAILKRFQGENLLIALAGTLVGAAASLGLNLWTVHKFEAARLPGVYVLIGMAALIALGQLAALWPAWRAAWVPPSLAARSL